MAYNFKKPEEVKEYLKNIYLEYKFGCESEKTGKACHLLGDYEEAIKNDYAKAGELYKSNCDERDWAKSCLKYAGYKAHGMGSEKDINESYKYMKKSCDLGEGIGCVRAGILAIIPEYKFMDNRAKQVAEGMEMLSKACHKFDEEKGCFHLAGLYLGGLKGEVEKNYEKAYKLLLKSCEVGNPYACANLAQMYIRGEGIEKNEMMAEAFKQKAITLQRETKEYEKQLEFGIQR